VNLYGTYPSENEWICAVNIAFIFYGSRYLFFTNHQTRSRILAKIGEPVLTVDLNDFFDFTD